MEDRQRYFSYLLRIWRVGNRDQSTWRASLEDTHTGERVGFASLQALCQFLDQKTASQGETPSSFSESEKK